MLALCLDNGSLVEVRGSIKCFGKSNYSIMLYFLSNAFTYIHYIVNIVCVVANWTLPKRDWRMFVKRPKQRTQHT